MKMKDMPQDDRPYERCFREGPEVLSDTELLSIIIRSGSKEANSMDLARQILALNYPKEGILGLLHISLPELMKIHGIGKVKGIQLLCIGELSKRIWRSKAMDQEKTFTSAESIAAFYQESMRHMEQEETHIMMFNTKQMLLREMCISKGTVNGTMVGTREIFIEALRYQAVHVILVHNHPSGDPEPSREDILLSQRVQEAGEIIGVTLLDHIIIGDGRYISLKERGYI
jgi:DNA repair protein RadC